MATGRPALIAALPAYGGLGVLVGVLMGPTGMAPADMAEAAAASPLVRALLWSAWLAAMAPAARRLLLAPEAHFLRWLPIGRPLFWVAQAGVLVALELPWAVLWHLGSPPLGGIAAALLAAGFHAALAVRARGRSAWVAVLVIGGVAAALAAHPPLDAIAIAVGACALVLAIPAAFARAAEGPRSLPRPKPRGGAVVGLAIHHAGELIDTALAGRVVVAAAVAGGLAGLFVRINELGAGAAVGAALVAGAFGSVGAATRIATVLAGRARQLEWILASTGVSAERRAVAMAIAASAGAAVCGAAIGAVVAGLTGSVAAIGVSAVAAIGVVAVAVFVSSRPVAAHTARVWGFSLATAAGLSIALAAVGNLAVALPPAIAVAAFGALSS